MSPRPPHSPCRRAFTLIESMVTVVVIAALGSIASLLIVNAVDGYSDAANSAQLHAELSLALDRAAREIRKIELDTAAAGVAPNVTGINADSDDLQWTDGDGDAYRLVRAGADLVLEVDSGPAAVLLTDVVSFSVHAYDQDNVALINPLFGAACDAVRRVALDVTVQRNDATERLRTKVFIRSTMAGAEGG